MNAKPVESAAVEINRLHAEAVRFAAESRTALTSALQSAWRAGQLLIAEKKRVRRAMGGGGWMLWLERNFEGHCRTAARYMRLAAAVSDPEFLRGLSIRQAYLRLGIATEPKSRAETVRVDALPAYIRLANRLVTVLRDEARRAKRAGKPVTLRQDLAGLYEQLRQLFEPANNRPSSVSISPCAPPQSRTASAA